MRVSHSTIPRYPNLHEICRNVLRYTQGIMIRRDRAWFVRRMVHNPFARARGLSPYSRTNHVLSFTCLIDFYSFLFYSIEKCPLFKQIPKPRSDAAFRTVLFANVPGFYRTLGTNRLHLIQTELTLIRRPFCGF